MLRTLPAVVVLALALPATAAADAGRREAAAGALAALHVKTSGKPVTVYALPAPVAAGTRVTEAGRRLPARGGRATFPAPLVATASEASWLFYADDAPATNFAHAGRIVLVGRDSGRVTVRRTGFAPLVAGRLPAFLRDQTAYNAARYRIFERRWQSETPARAATAPRYDAFGATGPVDVGQTGDRRLTADALAAEATCVVRVSDALADFYDFAGVDRSRAALGSYFATLARLNPALVSVRYTPGERLGPAAFVDRLVRERGCRELLIYIAGGGYAQGPPAISLGMRVSAGKRTRITSKDLRASDVRALAAGHPDVGVSFILDAPYTGRFAASLTGLPNVQAVIAPGGSERPSIAYLAGVDAAGRYVRNTANPERLQELSNRVIQGLERFAGASAEPREALAERASGHTRSFLSWMLVRGWSLAADASLADAIAPSPLVFGPQTAAPAPGAPPSLTATPVPNRAPAAADRAASLGEDDGADVAFAATDPDGDALTFAVATQPAHGTLTATADGVHYSPAPDFNGRDAFTYTASDPAGATSPPATVTLTVASVPDPMTASDVDLDTDEDTPASVDLRASAHDPDGDPISAVPASGTTTEGAAWSVAADGTFSYDPRGLDALVGGASVDDQASATLTTPDGDTVSVDVRIELTGIDDPPAVATSSGGATYTEDGAAIAIDPNLTVSDPDSVTAGGATVRVSANFDASDDVLAFADQNGISGSFDATTGRLTLAGPASLADYQAALRSITYRDTDGGAPSTAPRTISVTVGASAPATRTVDVSAVDDGASFSGLVPVSTYLRGDATGVLLAPSAGISDPDDDRLGKLSVELIGPTTSGDELLFTPQSGIAGTYANGILELTGDATLADYQAAARTIRYRNLDPGDPGFFARSVSIVAYDPHSATAGGSTGTIDVVAPPQLTGGGNTAGYTEDDTTGVVIDSTLTVADEDSAQLSGATVTITAPQSGDQLVFTNQGGITGSFASGVLTLSGAASASAYETALRSVRFRSTDTKNPPTTPRTIEFTAGDGTYTSSALTDTVTVTAVNDAPVVGLSGGGLAFSENGAAKAVDPGLTVTDGDNSALTGATVEIVAGYAAGEGDALGFANQNGITGVYANGLLTLTGTASVASYQAALRSVTFANTSDTPTTSRSVRVVVTDGTASSAVKARTIAIAPYDDSPAMTGDRTRIAYAPGDAATPLLPSVSITDVDSTTMFYASVGFVWGNVQGEDVLEYQTFGNITGSVLSDGSLEFQGVDTIANYELTLRSVSYRNAAASPATRSLTGVFNVASSQSSVGGATFFVDVG